jgi:hypothetical protein
MISQENRFKFFLNIFNQNIKKAITLHKKNPKHSPAKYIYTLEGRTQMFQLQGLARIECQIGKNKKVAKIWLEEFKIIEDAIGKYDYWYVLLEKQKNSNIHDDFVSFIQEQLTIQIGFIESALLQYNWIEKIGTCTYEYKADGYNKYLEILPSLKWHKPKKEYLLLTKFFKKECLKIKNIIINNELNLNDVENGIHELRRKLRWIAIYSSCLLGKVKIATSEYSGVLKKYITRENINNKFNNLPDFKVSYPVLFSKGGFYAMNILIAEIGEIKDRALTTEEYLQIGKWFKVSKVKIEKHLGENYITHPVVVKKTKGMINKFLIEENILQHIAEHFELQLKAN